MCDPLVLRLSVKSSSTYLHTETEMELKKLFSHPGLRFSPPPFMSSPNLVSAMTGRDGWRKQIQNFTHSNEGSL